MATEPQDLNDTQRCRTCGEHLTDRSQFFCEAWPPLTEGPDFNGLSFCETVFLERVDLGWEIPEFIPWPDELRRRQELMKASVGGGGPRGRPGTGPRTCAGPNCDEPVHGQQRYHAEKCRAAAYRLRRKGHDI